MSDIPMDDGTYWQLFKKANLFLKNNQVLVEYYSPTEVGAVFILKVKEYVVQLNIQRSDSSHIWKREFSCDCRANARNNQEMCSHVLASLVFLTTK